MSRALRNVYRLRLSTRFLRQANACAHFRVLGAADTCRANSSAAAVRAVVQWNMCTPILWFTMIYPASKILGYFRRGTIKCSPSVR